MVDSGKMLNQYIRIHKFAPVDVCICAGISGCIWVLARVFSNHAALQTEVSHGVPIDFPQPLSRTPDAAGGLDALAQPGLRVVNPHGNHIVRVAARMACPRNPRRGFHDQFHGLVPHAVLRIVAVAYADQPSAISCEQLLGAVLPRARLRRVSIIPPRQ